MDTRTAAIFSFSNEFGSSPDLIVRAPGRVNLIGEHTDYNDGFVLPMAIDRAVWIALRPRPDRRVRVHALEMRETVEFRLDDLQKGSGWAEYLKGVAWALQEEGLHLQGWEGILSGDVPRGAGLSSSAAVEVAAARAFYALSGLDWEAGRAARLAQKAENQWVGVNCGIMDQMVSAAAVEGHALFLDCRTLDYEHVPLPAGLAVVVLDTSTRRGLVDSAYNERRAQCEAAARHFGVKALRDVSMDRLEVDGQHLPPVVLRRARHIVSENERVLQAVQAMRAGDAIQLGKLFNASNASLRDDFEVTNEALNWMVEIAQSQPGCYGARMTGAGFGGCAVALVDEKSSGEFAVYVCKPSAGGSVEQIAG
jgi:galactokinase